MGLFYRVQGMFRTSAVIVKNFSDRFAYTHHRPKFFEKKVLLVANGGAGLDKTLNGAVSCDRWPKSCK